LEKKEKENSNVYSCAHEHGPCEPEDGHRHAMDHHHEHRGHKVRERKILLVAIFITLLTMAIEFIGGWWSNSLALMSDAGHMLSHFLALALAYGAIWIASRDSSPDYSYGLFRSETLAALFNAFFLIIISGIILWEAYEKFTDPGPIRVPEMFGIALLGLVVNLATAGILMKANPESDLNIKGAFIHMISDTLSSVGVVIGAIIINYTGYVLMDPALSVMITVLILVWVYKLARSSIRVLLERTPEHMNVEDVKKVVMEMVPQIRDLHDVHIWEITTNMYNMTAHVVLDDIRLHEAVPVLSRIKEVLKKEFNIGHAILQLECTCVTTNNGG
jgi:cobalt-zinc-cadmium efflux system protein